MARGRPAAERHAILDGVHAAVVRNLKAAPGIPPEQVLVVLHEPPLANWGVRGGRSGLDVDLGFKPDV